MKEATKIDCSTDSQWVPVQGSSRSAATLLDLLEQRVENDPDFCAYRYLSEDGRFSTLTLAELQRSGRAIGRLLQQVCFPGDRVLLVYPPGLDFVSAFFGCMYARVLPVPASYPKPRRPMPRLLAIRRDCDASLALTVSQTLQTLELPRSSPELEEIEWLATDGLEEELADDWQPPSITSDDLAFLQYTSGSTSDPKGVMVTHGNLLHNLAMIHRAFGIDRIHADGTEAASVWWLPAYHDMGLIGGVLGVVHNKAQLVMMSPASFLKRPLGWLQAMSDFRATISGAPNFAYEMCVSKTTAEERAGLDLSRWRLAFCGAEPVQAETLKRFADAFAGCGFREEAFYPCYGLAEATLLVAGSDGPCRPVVQVLDRAALADHRIQQAPGGSGRAVREVVGCGTAWLGQELAIVDLDTHCRLPEHQVGEIWVRGASVAKGYWNRPEETRQEFNAALAGDPSGGYLRTGDLGFFSDGVLYVTGRVKQMIVVRGRNLYPQDIELSVARSHPALDTGAGAAFTIEAAGEQRLVVVHEVDRRYRNGTLEDVLCGARRAIVDEHELGPNAIVLIRQASLPRTTSGKVQRNLCRQQYLDGGLTVVAQWPGSAVGEGTLAGGKQGAGSPGSQPQRVAEVPKPPPFSPPGRPLRPSEIDRLAERIEDYLLQWLEQRAAPAAPERDGHRPFAEHGLDSLAAVELSGELERWLPVPLTPVVAWNYPTPAALARYLAEQVGGQVPAEPASPGEGPSGLEFQQLLAEVESLSESETESELHQQRGDAGP